MKKFNVGDKVKLSRPEGSLKDTIGIVVGQWKPVPSEGESPSETQPLVNWIRKDEDVSKLSASTLKIMLKSPHYEKHLVLAREWKDFRI